MTAPSPGDQDLPEALEDEVLAILDGDEARRTSALADLLGQHPDHSRTIRAWLSSAGVAVPSAPDQAADPDALPRDVGPYRLTALLGRGGFGSVFRADQRTPIKRAVAVKVINPGMDSREILSRFHAEREALNRMDHPGIARLLDAGTTEQGRPYFVMELVEGPPLATLCRQRGLPLTRRLELFLMVLDAVAHAHQKAVIHRDLSSINVLVAESEDHLQPKIIDFGIAKSLADPLLRGGAMTFQGTLMGTPEFMSPEQAAGHTADVDTRSDVYALGVQLYELLSDDLPIPSHVLRAKGPTGIAEVIRSHEPPPPSAAAPRERQPAVRGDLDAITMRAIAKLREERYGSVADFAADIRAHLRHEPVRAGEPSTWHRVRKFVRRHHTESLAIAVVALGLLVAVVGLGWALQIANSKNQQIQRQNEEIARRADDGFRLLVNEDRLATAIATERALPPPWPEHRQALVDWIAVHGQPLADERSKLQEKLGKLATRREDEGGHFADAANEHLYKALQRLGERLAEFTSFSGPLQRVERKLALLDEVPAPDLERHRALWQTTIDEVQEAEAYRGRRLRPLPGLVPLGRNEATGLFEFGEAKTGKAGAPVIFVLIPAGNVRMGAVRGLPGLERYDPDAKDDELGAQPTRLDFFLIAKTELTRAQWSALRDDPVPLGAEAELPATGIDWHEARAALRQYELDLPTEAQWEYACRAGTTTPWSAGSLAEARAANPGIAAAGPQPVAQGQPNAWGLYDVHGNVAEWCRDVKLPYADPLPRTGDGLRGNLDGDAPRVVRGGAWGQDPRATRSTARDQRPPSTREPAIGLRPVRGLR